MIIIYSIHLKIINKSFNNNTTTAATQVSTFTPKAHRILGYQFYFYIFRYFGFITFFVSFQFLFVVIVMNCFIFLFISFYSIKEINYKYCIFEYKMC
jgi:hypothetical protein